jgi:transcriptional regulator with XRE-family HTH domain
VRIVPNSLISDQPDVWECASAPAIRATLHAMSLRQRQELGKRVRQARERLGLDRLHFAHKAEISRNTLQTLEEATKETTDRVLDQVASALGMTVAALVGTPPLDLNDPKLRDLSEEDLEFAQAFHHAPLRIKQRALGVLQERLRHEALTEPVSDWAKRLLALRDDQRAILTQLITELETHRAAEPLATGQTTSVAVTTPLLREASPADRLRQEITQDLERLGLESLTHIRSVLLGFIRAEQRSARDQKHLQSPRVHLTPPGRRRSK